MHLLYTTGHTAPAGADLIRDDLVLRAIGLARMVAELMPDEREARGLLALLLLTHARRATRQDPAGRLLLLEDQDRSQWDQAAIGEGIGLVVGALRGGRPGRFALQAAIAAVHAEAPSYAETDWPELLGLYDVLLQAWPSPVVALNRAVVLAMVTGRPPGWPRSPRWRPGAGSWPGTATCTRPRRTCCAARAATPRRRRLTRRPWRWPTTRPSAPSWPPGWPDSAAPATRLTWAEGADLRPWSGGRPNQKPTMGSCPPRPCLS